MAYKNWRVRRGVLNLPLHDNGMNVGICNCEYSHLTYHRKNRQCSPVLYNNVPGDGEQTGTRTVVGVQMDGRGHLDQAQSSDLSVQEPAALLRKQM
jgi:hypothetical protein